MNTINHHLTDQLLMAYAAGNLPEAFNLIVATHVTMCDECRARLESFEAVGGALIASDDCAEMAPDALGDVLSRICEMPSPEIRVSGDSRAGDKLVPAPLTDYVGRELDRVKWRALGGGVRQAVLDTGGAATARLLHIPAGKELPEPAVGIAESALKHQSRLEPLVAVFWKLQGAFSDADGRFA